MLRWWGWGWMGTRGTRLGSWLHSAGFPTLHVRKICKKDLVQWSPMPYSKARPGQTRRGRGETGRTLACPGLLWTGSWAGEVPVPFPVVQSVHPTPPRFWTGDAQRQKWGVPPTNTMLRSKGGVRPGGALFVVLSPDCILESLGVFKQAQDFLRDVDVLVGGRVRASGFLKLSTRV